MYSRFLLFVLLAVTQNTFAQSEIDSLLYKKLDTMFKEDQKWRKEYIKINRSGSSSYTETTISKNLTRTDSANQSAVKDIINKYGFPGFSLVGKSGSNKFWAIVQHCDDDVEFQQKVLTLMNKEVNSHNASGEDYAYLKDRVLINQGHKQLYGTQAVFNKMTKKHTPLPIQDEAHVETRRKAIGLSTLKSYLKDLDNIY